MKRKLLSLVLCASMFGTMVSGCGNSQSPSSAPSPSTDSTAPAPSGSDTASATAASGDAVTLEFAQWWEPELPDGSLRALMDQFEKENPGIKVKLLSAPYASTKEQMIAGAATNTMSDVVGLDGAWVSDFVKQGSITDLTKVMKDQNYDDSQLASQIKINGSTYMIPVVNFVYPVFINNDLLKASGIDKAPTTRTEFVAAAKAMTNADKNIYGWVLPLSLETPNGIQNDVMSWVWATGKSMLKDGQPDLENDDVKSASEYIKGMYDDAVITPGAFAMKEQDKVEEFSNGRVGMMIDSLAHINLIKKSNPSLNFILSALPAVDGYTGQRGLPYASWGIGISDSCQHKVEAWKLVQFLMSKDVNAQLATLANAFPGNTQSVPDFSKSDPLFKEAFDIYKSGYPANEFVGLPASEDLMRSFDEEFQAYLQGDEDVTTMQKNAQASWVKQFK